MDLELGVPTSNGVEGWNSWSAMKGRRRQAMRLSASASVDSLPCAENEFFSSLGSISNFPDYEEDDGSVNNILDAFGDRATTASSSVHRMSGAVSWSVLDGSVDDHLNPGHGHKPMLSPGLTVLPPSPSLALGKRDNESSGVGTDTTASISPTGSGVGRAGGSGASSYTARANNVQPAQQEYEHVYCQLDPYFNPPLSLTKSQPIVSLGNNTRLSTTRASIRSWGRSSASAAGTMERDAGIIPFLQQALAIRYREMLDTYLQAPEWYRQHMGTTDLDEICPVLYQILPAEKTTLPNPIYGTTTHSSRKGTAAGELPADSNNYRPILPHQIFSKQNEDEPGRAFWLEGDAGSGKTLLSLKLVQEWISYHSYNYTNTPLNTRIGEFSIVLYVPLREVRGTLNRFLTTDLIHKRSVLSRVKPGSLWKLLTHLGPSLLLILDGLDDVTDAGLLSEVQDVVNGLTFPQSYVLLTSRSRMNGDGRERLNQGSLRKFIVGGMGGPQIQCSLRRYFTGRKFGGEGRLVEILAERYDLTLLAANPFMCLLLCFVFEEVGDIPCSDAEFYSALLRCLIYQNGLIKIEPGSKASSTLPIKWQKVLEDFGRLCLNKLEEGRAEYTESEVLDYCPNLDILKTGVATRSKSFFTKRSNSKKSSSPLCILHPSLNVFLAANYLSTRVNYPNILRREMELLPGVDDLTESTVRNTNLAFGVTQVVMEILQKKSSAVFSTLSLLDISLNYLLALLRAAGFYETNLSAVCNIIRSVKTVTINVGSEWVSEWKQVISSPYCPFETVEILIKPGHSLSRLIEGLCLNESVSCVKLSSVPGQEWTSPEVNLVSGQLLRLLSEKKLKCLEISMTCLEDSEHSRFQGIIDVLCYVLSHGVPLSKLVLDMDLTSVQIEQLVDFIKEHETLDIFHVPHLGCGPQGFRAIAHMLRDKPFLSLSLAGSWRSTHPDEELDLVSEPMPLASPFNVSAQRMTPFSSLPRGPMGITLNGSMKSPSIRRRRLPGSHLQEDDKRNSDSVLFQRNFLPVPICDKENHEVDGFHGIFSVLRSQDGIRCNLRSLNLSKCVMNWEDVICLGETVRKTRFLDTLRMEGMKLCDVLPLLLGLQENTSLKLLDLSSPHVVIGDDALQLVAHSLSRNQTLRLLSIQGWTFYIEEERSLESLETLFRSSNLQDLDLTGVRLHIHSTSKSPQQSVNGTLKIKESTLERPPPSPVPQKLKKRASTLNMGGLGLPVCPALSFLRLGGITVELSKTQIWRSHDVLTNLILPRLESSKLTHLDISLDKNDTGFLLEEKIALKTLKLVASNFPKLQTLVIQHWNLRLTNEKTACKEFARTLSSMECLSQVNCSHSTVTLDGGRRLDSAFAGAFISSLKSLREFTWTGFDSGVGQVLQLGKILTETGPKGPSLSIRLEGVPLSVLKTLLLVTESKAGLTVQYMGNHSILVQTRVKEKGDHLMDKLKRLL